MAANKGHQNLISITERDPERAREIRQMGARASNSQRHRNKTLRDAFRAMQEVEIPTKSGDVTTASDAIALAVMQKAVKGDMKAVEFLWEALYGKTQKVDVTSSDGSMSPATVNLGDHSPEELMAFFKTLKGKVQDGAGTA
jgi:hypothetical protein